MTAALHLELLDRALQLVEARQTDMADTTHALPASVYVDSAPLQRDLGILRQTPVVVAHHSEVSEPGDYVTCDVGGVPVLVLRDREGRLRAFVNRCRHRGAKLVSPVRGRKLKQLVCPYHAWSYGCDGRLGKIPCAEGFGGNEARNLRPLPLVERFGFVFVRADGERGGDPHAWFEPLAELDHFGLDTHAQVLPYERRVEANWKLVVDTGLEAYHVRSTHRDTIYKKIFFDNCAVVDPLGPHLRIVFPKTNIDELRESPRTQWDLRRVAYVGYLLFPNTTLLLTPDHVVAMTVIPDGATSCRVKLSTLTPTFPASPRDWAVAKHNSSLMDRTFDEDFAMAESIASGSPSGNRRGTRPRADGARPAALPSHAAGPVVTIGQGGERRRKPQRRALSCCSWPTAPISICSTPGAAATRPRATSCLRATSSPSVASSATRSPTASMI